MSGHFVDIIIPTWNNIEYLYPCVCSIVNHHATPGLFRIIVVNNGHKESVDKIRGHKLIDVIDCGENLGWEGGLARGLESSKTPFVVFMNDDTYVPPHSRLWINKLLSHFAYPNCAAVGPSSNCVMGVQNIFASSVPQIFKVPFLIGFCMMIKREYLDQVGGVDLTMPGGDDIDLSIRLRKFGKYLICDREVFIYHHGFVSGIKAHGSYWNSAEMTERTNNALIRKHGLREFYNTMIGGHSEGDEAADGSKTVGDVEGGVVRHHVIGSKILEIGCGGLKTLPGSVGLDIVPKDEFISSLENNEKAVSIADVVADASGSLPFEKGTFDTIIARHILEHMVDPIETTTHWKKVLRPGGRLIVAVPDHTKINSIPMNFEHVHAFTPMSLQNIMQSCGWKTLGFQDVENGISFVGVFENNGR